MIVIEDEGGATCVGQAAHAWISGQLARAWGNERFAAPDPFDEVCLGAEQHDLGMAEFDLAPTLDPRTGLPSSFMRMPVATHLELWGAAPGKALSQSPYAALIVSMHGHALYARRDTLEPDTDEAREVHEFVLRQEAFQRDLLERLDEPPQRARRNQRLVWALDFLSLALFMRTWIPDTVPAPTGNGDEEIELLVAPAGERRVTVDPWPFRAGSVAVHCQARRLEGRFETEGALHEALAAARWQTLSFELARC